MGSLKTSNVLYLSGLVAVLLLVVNVFVVAPSRKIKATRQQLAEVQEAVARAEAELDSLRDHPSDDSQPSASQNAPAVSPLELLSTELGVEGLVFRRLETGRGEGGIVPFSLDARGSFQAVVTYLHKISASPIPVLILDLSLSPETDDGRVFSLQLSGQLAVRSPNG